MKRTWRLYACALLAFGLSALSIQAQTVNFETVPAGTQWGQAFGQNPGDIVLTQDSIDMSVEQFFLDAFIGFNTAEVGDVYEPFLPANHLALENISVRFDLLSLPFNVTEVTLDYQEFGGSDNFAVNGGSIYELAALTDLPVNVAPGVTAAVTPDTITLTGKIDTFLIGGQELAIDNITAVPEPTSLALLALGAALLRRRRT
jgi:hypothetical protein